MKLKQRGVEIDDELVKSVIERRGSTSSMTDTSDRNKDAQYVPDGFGTITQYYDSGFVEMLCFRGDLFDAENMEASHNRSVVVVDSGHVLFNREDTASQIRKGGWKPRPDNLWSQGALDNVISINYMVNHRENAKNDAIDKFVHPDRAYIGDVDEIYDEVTGQTKYIMPEGGQVSDITPDSTVLSYNSEIGMHLDFARRAARLPQQLAGFRTPGEKTALEVQNLNDGAFRGFINKAEQFEQEFLEKLISDEIKVSKENFSSVVEVMSPDEDGIFSILEITEDDLATNGKLEPYGARRFSRLLQQQAGINQLANSNLGALLQAHTSTWNVAQAVSTVFGFDDFKLFEKNVAVREQLEMQQEAAMAENEFVAQQSQPSPQELGL
jgi:hypothetical protein